MNFKYSQLFVPDNTVRKTSKIVYLTYRYKTNAGSQ